MNLNTLILAILILKLNLLSTGLSERTKDQMYEHFNGRMSCFRRLNGTHQIGCSSKRGGSTGIIHYVETADDLEFIVNHGSDTNYIPIIPMQLLTQNTMRLLNAKKFSGLIVYKSNMTLEHFTHEHTCPNTLSNIKDTCDISWNSQGTGLLYEDLPFPIYYVNNDEDLEKMKNCFEKFNNFSYDTHNTRALCLVELDAFMFATIDTPTCIRRSNLKTNLNPVKFCDPLGGENIWATLFPLAKEGGDYIVVAARLDTTSLFHGMFPGAVSPITGVVTLLTVADYLKRMVGKENYGKNILFVLFNGESYDYIGSQRMVYDMQRGEFPIKPEKGDKNPVPLIELKNISLFVELSHLSKSNELYLHSLNKDNTFYKVLKNNSLIPINEVIGRLPPASAQTFVKVEPRIPAVVLANYKEEYKNMFFNSINDNASNIGFFYYNTTEEYVSFLSDTVQKFTADIAETLSKSLYQEIAGKVYSGPEKVRVNLVNELYNCYLLDADCKVHQAVQRKKLREGPYNSYSLYVGVTVVPNLLTYAIGLTLAWLTGTVTSNTSCVNETTNYTYQYFNMSKDLDSLNTTVCYRSIMNFSEAISPAFVIDDYDWKSGQYSSWSESTWKDLNVRMFLRPSPAHERFTLAIGSVTLVMSIIVVYFIKSRSDVLFSTVETCSPTSC